jgi:regulator of protease activity HflC (stomatin/prohibitin superfamily)
MIELQVLVSFSLAAAALMLVALATAVFVVQPREAHIVLYWGRVARVVTEPGIHFASPIGRSRRIVSTRDTAFSTPVTTVVEAHGNPIQVSAVVVYRVVDAAKAAIEVQGYQAFVLSQTSSVLKMVSSQFPYEARPPAPSLKHESPEILQALTDQLQKQVWNSGVQILLVRLNDLTYAPEIAQSMLLRQQAQALVDARRTLVDGAVALARDAIDRLDATEIRLEPRARAQLAVNLVLLLCAGERGDAHGTVVTRARG